MKKPKNKIVYKKPGKDAYDSPALHGCINDEFGQFESGSVKLPILKNKSSKLVFKEPKNKPEDFVFSPIKKVK